MAEEQENGRRKREHGRRKTEYGNRNRIEDNMNITMSYDLDNPTDKQRYESAYSANDIAEIIKNLDLSMKNKAAAQGSKNELKTSIKEVRTELREQLKKQGFMNLLGDL